MAKRTKKLPKPVVRLVRRGLPDSPYRREVYRLLTRLAAVVEPYTLRSLARICVRYWRREPAVVAFVDQLAVGAI